MEPSPQKINVVFAWHHLSWGGAQVMFSGIARNLPMGCSARMLLPEGSSEHLIKRLESSGTPLIFGLFGFDLEPATSIWSKIRRHALKLRGEIRFTRFILNNTLSDDILHVELAPWQSALALIVLSANRRVFVTIHNRMPNAGVVRRATWKLKFWILNLFSNLEIVTANKDARDSLKDFLPKALFKKIEVLRAGVDLENIGNFNINAPLHRREMRPRLGLADATHLVVTVGQFIPRKGPQVLMEAATRIYQSHPEAKFLWLTDRINKESADFLNRETELKNFKVVTMGEIGGTPNDVFRFLAAADIFVLPSLVEGLPISLLEAMAMGLPCISTNINAVPEAIEDGRTGVLVKAGDADELACAIQRLLDNPEYANKLGTEGRESLNREFDEKVIAQSAARLYGNERMNPSARQMREEES